MVIAHILANNQSIAIPTIDLVDASFEEGWVVVIERDAEGFILTDRIDGVAIPRAKRIENVKLTAVPT